MSDANVPVPPEWQAAAKRMLRNFNRKARRAALRQRKPLTSADRIRSKCANLAEFLVAKNKSYGDSALRPVGIFAKGRASDLIRVRLDDKLSRIRNAPDAFGEDVVKDLLGYLVLYQLALEDEGSEGKGSERSG